MLSRPPQRKNETLKQRSPKENGKNNLMEFSGFYGLGEPKCIVTLLGTEKEESSKRL